MRTIEILALQFSELSEKAQDRAYNKWLQNADYPWAGDNEKTLKEFAKVFPITITNWSYGDRGEGVSWHFDYGLDDAVHELTGVRLLAYLWNNYKDSLFNGKYYHSEKFGLTDHRINHKRVESKQIISKCPNQGKWSNSYHSAIFLENSCVLTGYCIDDDILEPIYNFMDKPSDITFKELLEDCFSAWIKSASHDYEYCMSKEYYEDECESNEWEFTEDGDRI